MKRRAEWVIGGGILLGLLLAAGLVQATGIDDFKLVKAIPADAMLAVHGRHHDGQKFIHEQYKRVWAEVEKQHFDRDLKRMIQGMIKEQGGDVAAFETHWQQITDLAAGVEWSRLCEQEMAFAMKLAAPVGVEFVVLAMPAKERVAEDFDGLAAILKSLSEVEPGNLQLTKEGEGASVVYKLTVRGLVVPLALTLARHQDVLLMGFGSAMPEQALVLLRGAKEGAPATLASTDRFKQAFKKLPPPKDGLVFVDIAKIMAQSKVFADMAAKARMGFSEEPESAPATTQPAQPLAFLVPLVEALDIWDYAAAVVSTDGMQTVKEEITVLRDDARSKPLGKVLYGNPPVKDVLKFVPKQATGVSAGSGLDFRALYRAILDFVRDQVPQGKTLLAQWEEKKAELPFDVEEDLLSWIGGGYTLFSAPIPTPFMPGTVIILEVKDEAKAKAALDRMIEWINTNMAQQNAGVEDAKIEGAEGFKRIILPPQFMMVPGLGQPVFGLKDGHLILSNGPKVLALALKAAAGEEERFDKNERFTKEGLPLAANMTGFSFKDLTNWGTELSQALSMAGIVPMFAPDLAKNPVASNIFFMVSKLANVVKKLDFYLSECTVTTREGSAEHSKTVVHYQEPPKKAEPTTQAAPGEEPGEKPEKAKPAPEAEKPKTAPEPAKP